MITTALTYVALPLIAAGLPWCFKWNIKLIAIPISLTVILFIVSVYGVRNCTSKQAAVIESKWDILERHQGLLEQGLPLGEYTQDLRQLRAETVDFVLHANEAPVFYKGRDVAVLAEKLLDMSNNE